MILKSSPRIGFESCTSPAIRSRTYFSAKFSITMVMIQHLSNREACQWHLCQLRWEDYSNTMSVLQTNHSRTLDLQSQVPKIKSQRHHNPNYHYICMCSYRSILWWGKILILSFININFWCLFDMSLKSWRII